MLTSDANKGPIGIEWEGSRVSVLSKVKILTVYLTFINFFSFSISEKQKPHVLLGVYYLIEDKSLLLACILTDLLPFLTELVSCRRLYKIGFT